MMDLTLCKICKEPIWNFLCVDCLAEDVRKAMPEHLADEFSAFHRRFVRSFHSHYEHMYCIKCKNTNSVTVCPYCYLKEVFTVFSEKDTITAKRLIRFLPFFKHPYKESDAKTLTEFRAGETNYGVCDCCGEYSDLLMKTDEGWLCENCIGD